MAFRTRLRRYFEFSGDEIRRRRIMESKIEYQLSPELAEKLAIERLALSLRSRGWKSWHCPVFMGIIFAIFFVCSGGCTNSEIHGEHYSVARRMFGATISFAIGYGIGFLVLFSLRSKIMKRARADYKKWGARRSISWNSEDFTISSPDFQTKIRWQMIDEITSGEIGIYLMSGSKSVFVIPKKALPADLAVEDLIKAWRDCATRPPKFT